MSRKVVHEVLKNEILHPTGFNLLLEIDGDEEVTEAGLVIPGADHANKMGACRARVVEVGPLAGRDKGDSPSNWGAIVGYWVCFDRYKGSFYTREGTSKCYIIIQEKDIEGFIDPKETEDARRAS